MPVCIAGMHRSGTSMVARLLNLSGVYLGEPGHLIAATTDNPDGHWEHRTVVGLNDEILSELGAGWDYPPAQDADWKGLLASKPRRRKIESLSREFEGREPWGWKDPRSSLTFPFWRALWPELRVVVCVRNPLEVAVSLKRRGLSSYALGLRLWSIYNQRLIDSVDPSRRIVTHYEALLTRPRLEIARVLDFLNVDPAPGAIEDASIAARGELRHNRFTTRHLLAAEIDAQLLQQYLDLCDSADWGEEESLIGAVTTTVSPGPPSTRLPDSRATAVVDAACVDEDLLHREIDAHLVTIRELRAKVEEQARALRARGEELRDRGYELRDLELAFADAQAELRRLEESRQVEQAEMVKLRAEAGRSYDRLKRQFQVLVEQTVPRRATTVVISRGDEALVKLKDRRAWHFPRTEKGGWAGHYPADSEEAVAHLEALRAKGAAYLIVPEPSRWWLDHYRGLSSYLDTHARLVADHDGTAIVFELEKPAWRRRLIKTVADFETRFGREPAVLDWRSGLDLRDLPSGSVFSPPDPEAALPYLDRTIDIVVCPDEPAALAEARRVAISVIVSVSRLKAARRQRKVASEPTLGIEWLDQPSKRRPARPRATRSKVARRGLAAGPRSRRTKGRR